LDCKHGLYVYLSFSYVILKAALARALGMGVVFY